MIKNPVFSLSILIKRFNMSTDYIPDKNIPFDEIEKFNHNGVKVENIEDGNVLLTDCVNYMWVHSKAVMGTYKDLELISMEPYEGSLFTRYGGNDPTKIIEAVEDFFKVRLISEDEDEYYKIVSRRKFKVIKGGSF